MLFCVKKYLSLEILVTLFLGSVGYWQTKLHNLPLKLRPDSCVLVSGLAGFIWLAVWTRLVQYGYGIVKGKAYAQNLTAALAKQFVNVGSLQMMLGGFTAALVKRYFFVAFYSNGSD